MTTLEKDLAEVVPGELDNTSPEIIWLQIDTSASNEDRDELWPGDDCVTWCSESIGGLEVQYVRADIYRTHHAEIAKNAKDVKILRIKAAGTLANNLCPDHRDKQVGKPCLACEIERLEKGSRRLEALEMAMRECESLRYELEPIIERADEIMREMEKSE